MKTNKLLIMGMALAAVMGLGSCAESDDFVVNEPQNADGGKAVTINVVDNGYGDVTRAAESNDEEVQGENTIMQTNFIAGDKIGVFSISAGGAVHYNNLELRYNGTEWVNPDGETFYYFTGMRYYAYYPYNPDFDSENGVDWSAEGVDAFFAPYVTAWQPQVDQSTTKQYIASDLMVGAGAISGETFTFSMGHTMGLIFISVAEELNGTVYLFPKLTEAEAITSFTAANSKIFTFEQGVYKPTPREGYYRYIVKPGGNPTFISGANPDGRLFSFTCDNVSGGHYKKYVVDGGFNPENSTVETFTVRLGDVVYDDLHFAHRNDDGSTFSSTSGVVGAIAYMAERDEEYTEGKIHGLILKNSLASKPGSSYDVQWSYSQYTAECADYPGLTNCETVKLAIEDKSGLTNSIIVGSTQGYGEFISNQVDNKRISAISTKWFIPSSGQWIKIIEEWGGKITSPLTNQSLSFSYNSKIQPGVTNIKSDLTYLWSPFYTASNTSTWNPISTSYYMASSSEASASSTWVFKMNNTSAPLASKRSKTYDDCLIWRACAF